MSTQRLSPKERRSRLERVISDHVIQGYQVLDREMTWAEMYKPKRFSFRGFIIGLGIFYLIYYALIEREDAVRLEVSPQGDLVTESISVARAANRWANREG